MLVHDLPSKTQMSETDVTIACVEILYMASLLYGTRDC
jgi:hypothetical protein